MEPVAISSSQEWTSLREFARRCGRRHRAAQKAIEDGRIPASAVKRDARGRIIGIEVHEASRAWLGNTNPGHSPVPIPALTARGPGPARPVLSQPHLAAGANLGVDVFIEQLGRVLGIAFANALIPACAMAVARQHLAVSSSLDVLEDLLLATMFAAADAVGLDPNDDRPVVLFRGDLEATLHPDRRAELLTRIQAIAAEYVADEVAAAREAPL